MQRKHSHTMSLSHVSNWLPKIYTNEGLPEPVLGSKEVSAALVVFEKYLIELLTVEDVEDGISVAVTLDIDPETLSAVV